MIDDSMSILKFIIPKAHICFYICSQIKYYLKKNYFFFFFFFFIDIFDILHYIYKHVYTEHENHKDNNKKDTDRDVFTKRKAQTCL